VIAQFSGIYQLLAKLLYGSGLRLLRGAPIMAPLLFSNVGLLGLIVLLDPAEPTK